MGKNIIFVLIGIVILFFVFRKFIPSSNPVSISRSVNVNRSTGWQTNTSSNTPTTTRPLGAPTEVAEYREWLEKNLGGEAGALDRRDCRNVCRLHCGGPRCVLNVGDHCKSKKKCWDNCQLTKCNWL